MLMAFHLSMGAFERGSIEAGLILLGNTLTFAVASFEAVHLRPSVARKQNIAPAIFPDMTRAELARLPHGKYVYVIQDVTNTRYFKIGRTNNPARRLNHFDVILPVDIHVVAVLPCDNMVTLETWLHRRFADKRQRGEWFALSNDDVRWLIDLGREFERRGYSS